MVTALDVRVSSALEYFCSRIDTLRVVISELSTIPAPDQSLSIMNPNIAVVVSCEINITIRL